jgi:hypothetical protein
MLQWKLMMFGKVLPPDAQPGNIRFQQPDPRLSELRSLALWAAQAQSDAELARRAVYALGLHGCKTTQRNRELLRCALDELQDRHRSAYPELDSDDGANQLPPEPAGSVALCEWNAVIAEGTAQWLYRTVKGRTYGDLREQRQFLVRTAKGDPRLESMLDWALGWKSPPNPHARGRAGT